MTPETRADMFRRGYVYGRWTKQVVHGPYSHEEHELFFDVEGYNTMNRDFHTRPRQADGRAQADYGRTVLANDPPKGCVEPAAIALAVVALIMFSLWLGGFAGGVV